LTAPLPNPAFDEAAWLGKAQTGDFSAFEQLVGHFQDRLYRLARRITGFDQDAEDVVQQTFVSLIESIETFRGDASLWTWLVRVATNHALKILRKKRGLPIVSGSIASKSGPDGTSGANDSDEGHGLPHPEFIAEWRAGPQELAQNAEIQKLIDAEAANLDHIYRVVFLLRDAEGLSVKETAQALGISESLVKVRLLRARLQLRERLTRVLGDKAKRILSDHTHE